MLFTEMHVKVFVSAADMALYVGQAGEITIAADALIAAIHDGSVAGGNAGFPGKTNTVAATGSTIADAAPLKSGFNLVTAADATKGVILPAGVAGRRVEVKNSDAANSILKVWPPNAVGIINALTAAAAISMAAKTSCIFVCVDGTSWVTIPLVPS